MAQYNNSAAVDYQRFASNPNYQQRPTLEALPENRQVQKTAKAKVPYVKYTLIFACVFSVLMAILFSYVSVNELTLQNSRLKSQIAELESTEKALNAKKEQMYNLAYVEEYAKDVLGMVKLDKSSVDYVELSNPETMEVAKAAGYSSSFFKNIAKSFSAVLEYLN